MDPQEESIEEILSRINSNLTLSDPDERTYQKFEGEIVIVNEGSDLKPTDETTKEEYEIVPALLGQRTLAFPFGKKSYSDCQPMENYFQACIKTSEKRMNAVETSQKEIFSLLSSTSTQITNFISTSSFEKHGFVRMRKKDRDAKMNEIKILDQETQKTKFYLMTLIQRLEDTEYKLDLAIDKRSKR